MQIWNVEHALEQLIWFPQQVNEIEEKVRELFCLKETRNIANNAMCGLDIDSNQLKKKNSEAIREIELRARYTMLQILPIFV